MEFENSASAASSAAESAKKAIAAAEAAAYLAGKEQHASGFHYSWNGPSVNDVNNSQKSTTKPRSPGNSHQSNDDQDMRKIYRRHSYDTPPSVQSYAKFDESGGYEETEVEQQQQQQQQPPSGIGSPPEIDVRKIHRRHSYNTPSSHSDIKFDESDCDDDDEMESLPSNAPPPGRPAPLAPRVHPKLPDYDSLAARFEALKYPKHK